MDWITIIWSMAAAISLTLGGLHLLVSINQRTDWWRLLFLFSAVGAAAMAFIELLGMRLHSTTEYGLMVRWAQIPFTVMMLSVMWFVRSYLKAGRLWLAWLATGLRILAAILHFVFTPNLNFREITSLKQVAFLGETVSIPVGVPNPWTLIGQAGIFLILIFCLDATISAWRRDGPRRALFTGGSATFFLFLVMGQGTLVIWGFYQAPFGYSLMFLGIILAMGFELSYDVIRAAHLSSDLSESEERMALAADTAQFGIWIRNVQTGEIWASDKWREIFGFGLTEKVEIVSFLQKVHPDDRDNVSRIMSRAIDGGDSYETEYRIITKEGLLWITSRGEVEFSADGKPILVRDASLDVTSRKLAEESTFELSGRLVNVQEHERARLARELHDDLSQSLALLSFELQTVGQKPQSSQRVVSGRMDKLSRRVFELSVDVHRMSHELHPAKLRQLGLVVAVNSFCTEFEKTHGITVRFENHNVPRSLPEGSALCVYRIVQESLQNVAKHSKASAVSVHLISKADKLALTITDNGSGFDPEAVVSDTSLGLVSMRERIRLVNGSLSINSQIGKGTVIQAKIPTD